MSVVKPVARVLARRRVVLDCSNDKGRTKQSMKNECDINQIMKKFIKSGTIDHFTRYGGEYADVEAMDFREAMETVVKAEQMFADLPAAVRKKFANSPQEFLSFVQNPKNEAEMIELGLASKPRVALAAPAASGAAIAAPPSGGGSGAEPPTRA